MINNHTAYLVCNNTGETFKILDVKTFVKDIVNNKWYSFADNFFFEENRLEDCHGKSLNHIVQEAISIQRDKKNSLMVRYGRFGGYKRTAGSSFRHPKTTAELRAISGLEADGFANLVRGARKQLPSVYDDPWSPCFYNWKSFRKKQYK